MDGHTGRPAGRQAGRRAGRHFLANEMDGLGENESECMLRPIRKKRMQDQFANLVW